MCKFKRKGRRDSLGINHHKINIKKEMKMIFRIIFERIAGIGFCGLWEQRAFDRSCKQ